MPQGLDITRRVDILGFREVEDVNEEGRGGKCDGRDFELGGRESGCCADDELCDKVDDLGCGERFDDEVAFALVGNLLLGYIPISRTRYN
jgi:hypothetical protein